MGTLTRVAAPQWLWYVWPQTARDAAREHVVRGKAALDGGRFDDAVRWFTEALAAAREGFGRDHVSVAEPLSGLASALVGAGRASEAAVFVAEVLSFVDRGGFAESDWIQAHRDAADLYVRLGRLRTAVALWERIEARLEERVEHAATVAEAIFQQALARRWLFELDRACELARRLPETWSAPRALLLGRCAYLQGDYDEAVASYENLLRALPGLHGYRAHAHHIEASVDAAIVSSRLALALHGANRFDDGDRARDRAHVALGGLEGVAYERALSVVAFDDGERERDPRRALVLHERAAALRTKLDGPTDPSTIESRLRAAELASEVGDYALANAEARAILEVVEGGFGRAHPWVRRARRLAP